MPALQPSLSPTLTRTAEGSVRRASDGGAGGLAAAAVAALLVLVLAGIALSVSQHAAAVSLSRPAAVRDALASPQVTRTLAGSHWDRASVAALDGSLERVTFSAGSRTVAEVAIRANGTVDQLEAFGTRRVPYGDWIAYEPGVLGGLAALFALMTVVLPLRRLRNLDVLAMLSLIPTVLLFRHGYVSASVVSVLPGLCYLGCRCAWCGMRRAAPPTAPCTPVFDRLTAAWQPAQRTRVLRLTLLALALVFVMVGVSSPQPMDAAYAAMEGATKLIHGILPYGHLPGDVVHGDTYPILSYALYTPLALFAPVTSTWNSVDGALALAVLAALAGAIAVARPGITLRRRPRLSAAQPDPAPLRAAIAWLAFPPLLIAASAGTTDVVLAAMLAIAVVLWRRPALSSAVLALAAWFKLAPFALVPLWLAPRRGRRLLRSLAALAGVSLATLGLLVALGGWRGPSAMVSAVAFQFDRGSLQSPWVTLGLTGLQPLAQALVLALIAGAATQLRRDGESPTDVRRIAALSAAVMIGLQVVGNDWSFLYLCWFAPLIVVSLLSDQASPSASARP